MSASRLRSLPLVGDLRPRPIDLRDLSSVQREVRRRRAAEHRAAVARIAAAGRLGIA